MGIFFKINTLFYYSCVQAEPPVSPGAKNMSCIFNSKKGGLCGNIVSNQYIFGDHNILRRNGFLIEMFENYLPLYDISDACQSVLSDLYCRYLFPLCDTSLRKPHPQRICRTTCEFALELTCKKEYAALKKIAESDPMFDKNMINCSTFTTADGGEAPECYQHYPLPGEPYTCYIPINNEGKTKC